MVGADGAEVDDFAEEAIVVDQVHGYEAFRFGDTYFVSPQWHSDVDLSLPVLDQPALGHGQHRGSVLPPRRRSWDVIFRDPP